MSVTHIWTAYSTMTYLFSITLWLCNPSRATAFLTGEYDSKICNHRVDRIFWCTVVSGSIKWKKEYGAKYCCSASTDEWYYIHWIDPVLRVSDSRDLPSQAYGSTIHLQCSVPMTPSDISYQGIFSVRWQWVGSQTRKSWMDLDDSDTVKSRIAPEGANYSLTITNFNPIKHGGDYRCIGDIQRYSGELESERFSIKSKPLAKLKNNKRRAFVFGMYESNVRFTCDALSYPFPDRIEFKLQSAVIDEHTKGISEYEIDVVSINEETHKATFVVNNMSEVFRNDSVFECRVFRKGDTEEAISQTRIFLVEEAPPTETTIGADYTTPSYVTKRKERTEPWIIALAVIIPVVIILIIVVMLVWKCKRFGSGDSGGNDSLYQTPSNDLNRDGYYTRYNNGSLRSQRDPTYGSPAYSSEYAQSKVHRNPLYGTTPISPTSYGDGERVYQTPVTKPVASLPRPSHSGSLGRQLNAEYKSQYAQPDQRRY